MKKRTFVHRRLVFHSIIMPIIYQLPFSIIWLVSGGHFITLIGVVTVFYSFVFALQFCIRHNAFVMIEISKNGIKNRYISMSWKEIDEYIDYKLYKIELYKFQFHKPVVLPPVVGIGLQSSGEFYFQSNRDAIFFSLDKKTLAALKQYGMDSTIIKDIVSKFSEGSICHY